jgi:hypothetical protein
MSTMPGKMKFLYDNDLRCTAAISSQGTAQNKGTATDMVVTILAGPDGATAISGTVALAVQGSNVTSSVASNWTTVTADKGTLANITASGTQSLHYAQLQYQFYHLSYNGSAAAVTANVDVVWNFHPVEDSFDATVQ